jgi:hypothetical protein
VAILKNFNPKKNFFILFLGLLITNLILVLRFFDMRHSKQKLRNSSGKEGGGNANASQEFYYLLVRVVYNSKNFVFIGRGREGVRFKKFSKKKFFL